MKTVFESHDILKENYEENCVFLIVEKTIMSKQRQYTSTILTWPIHISNDIEKCNVPCH